MLSMLTQWASLEGLPLALLMGWSALMTVLSCKFFCLLWAPSPPIQDYGEHRRRLPYAPPTPIPPDVVHKTDYVVNSRGSLLHTQEFLPAGKAKVKGLIFLCCGYADTVSWLPVERAVRFAQEGYAVHGIDYEGAGRSDGLHVHIPCFETMVGDVYDYYKSVRQRHPELKAFLCGESMGGAVAIKLCLRSEQGLFDGAILLAPMVKIADSMKPPEIVITTLKWLVPLFPTLPMVPAPAVIEKAFRRKDVMEVALRNPFVYRKKPRLGTAIQLLEATESVNRQMELFEHPVLVLQGTGDMVTDPALAQEFHRRAGSKDKEIRLYEGFWHNLLSGELDEHVDKVYADVFDWLKRRVEAKK